MIPVWAAVGGYVVGSVVTLALIWRSARKAEKWENRH